MSDDVMVRVKGMKKSYHIIEATPVTDTRLIKNKMLNTDILNTKLVKKKIEYPVFENVNLEVRKGDILGILGRNGCGKSTFLKIIAKIIECDEGTVEVFGKIASILELSMGFHGDLSGRDNIILRSELYGIPRDKVLEKLDSIIEYSELGVFIDNPVRTYSSGMKSRLAFSVMVNVDADIFLVDEALSTGDMAFASKASEHLKNLVRSGKTVLFTSHSMNTIKRTCNRAIWISDRTIKMDGPADEVVDAYARSINDSFDETLSLAKGGSSSAQYRVATFYRDGNGVERDREQYMYWLQEAAHRDHPMAMSDLADIKMSEGRTEEAMELYQRAAENGNYEARRKYATMLGDTMKEIEELRNIMKDFTSSGYPYDLYNYGNLMYKSALTPGDLEVAFDYLNQSSEIGWAEADLLLGQMYRDGKGAERDLEKAIQHLSSAGECGNPKAMAILADLYYDGKYMTRNYEEAFKWYLKGASVGNPKSQFQVAVMLSLGQGTEKDTEAAKDWFARYSSTMINDSRKSAMETLRARKGDITQYNDLLKAMSRSNNPRSMTSLAKKYRDGKGFKKSTKGAINLLTKACAAGGAPRTVLAEMYLEQNEDGRHNSKILHLLKSAAAAGDGAAMYRLALLYKEGEIVEKDVEGKYKYYMRMAAENGSRDARDVVSRWNSRTARRKSKKDKEDQDPS